MSIQKIRENLNRPDLDYIWDLIKDKEGDISVRVFAYEMGLKKIKFEPLDILHVVKSLLDSGEYKYKFYIDGADGLYDSPLDIPNGIIGYGEIGVILKKVNNNA